LRRHSAGEYQQREYKSSHQSPFRFRFEAKQFRLQYSMPSRAAKWARVWGDPTATVRSNGKGFGRKCRSQAGVAPDSLATRRNGLSTVGQQSERTGSPLIYDSTTMECEIEAAIEWRVQERTLSSPAINGVSSSESKLD
jgi:hypothetical protein